MHTAYMVKIYLFATELFYAIYLLAAPVHICACSHYYNDIIIYTKNMTSHSQLEKFKKLLMWMT